jgi:hypothetical protein
MEISFGFVGLFGLTAAAGFFCCLALTAPRTSSVSAPKDTHEARHSSRKHERPNLAVARPPRPAPVERETRKEPQVADASTAEPAKDVVPRMVQNLATTVEREPVDPEWAGWAQQELTTRIEALEGSAVIRSHCGTTLCQLEIGFVDAEARDQALREISFAVPWDNDGFYAVNENDPFAVTVFVGREGHALPQLD